jgi:hypothetical protein
MPGMGSVELEEKRQTLSTLHAASEKKLVQQLENAVQHGLPAAVKSFVALCISLSSGVSAWHVENVSHLLPSTGALLFCMT